MIRLTIFIIALLLAVGAIEPEGAWLVTLAVLAGIELFRWRPFRSPFRLGRRFGRWLDEPWSAEFDW